MLCDERGRAATELLLDQDVAGAKRKLAEVLHIAPRFAPVNYMYAVCLLILGREPERAIAAAEIAAADGSVPEAELLLRLTHEMREALVINAAFKEHNAAVESVTGRPTRGQLLELHRIMEGLRRRIPELKSVATTRQNAKHVRDLAAAVDRRLVEIATALANQEVTDLVDRFNRWAMTARADSYGFDGLTVRTGALDHLAELRAIGRAARQLRRGTTDPNARKVLQDMINIADRFAR